MTLAGLGEAKAAFVTYTENVTAVGSLGGANFSLSSITITGTADTNNVHLSGGEYTVLLTSATFTIAGVGSGTFTDNVQEINITGAGIAGIQDLVNGGLQANDNSALTSYNLMSTIGPLSGTSYYSGNNTYFGTSAGNLIIGAVKAGSANFSATVSSSVVPEPSSLAMLGLGAAAVAMSRKKIAGNK